MFKKLFNRIRNASTIRDEQPTNTGSRESVDITTKAPRPNKPEHIGYVLVPGDNCCSAARSIRDRTFSSEDEVPLPLNTCDKKFCACKLRPVTDRRKINRREARDRRDEIRFDLNDNGRRKGSGRRKEEKIWDGGYS